MSFSTVSHWPTCGAAALTALMNYSVDKKRTEALSELKRTKKRTGSNFK